MATTASQTYLSTRGESCNLGFEDVVLKGLASDGGLFIPEEIPSLPQDWSSQWQQHSFCELASQIMSLFISSSEVPKADLEDIVMRSYGTFRSPDVTPLITLDGENKLYLLELFHGQTLAFKDVALSFLGNLFEYFLVRRNEGKSRNEKHHLTVIGATSGDTGSAAIYGLRGKKDVSVFILHPKGKISPIQEAQMTTVLDANVHNLAVEGSFDDCQDIVKALFADSEINKTHSLAAVNSINWARILAQITYYFHAYFSLRRSQHLASDAEIRFVVPTGNFGDVLAGWFAKQMGLPVSKFVIATNANDILDRFWKTGIYEKNPVHGSAASSSLASPLDKLNQAHPEGVKETLSPALDILVSSNFERLLWYLAYKTESQLNASISTKRALTGEIVRAWLTSLKASGKFSVPEKILQAAQVEFESERVSDEQTLHTIRATYDLPLPKSFPPSSQHATKGTLVDGSYILDPHTAVGINAAWRSIKRVPTAHHIALATAHPAKFAQAVELALGDEDWDFATMVMPDELRGLEKRERRVRAVGKGEGMEGVRKIIMDTMAGTGGD